MEPTTMGHARQSAERRAGLVVHPLDDRPEPKLDTSHLPPIAMTRSVRGSLLTLRAYLVIMTLLIVYHFLDLLGLVHWTAH
jgi:hypothetical protein